MLAKQANSLASFYEEQKEVSAETKLVLKGIRALAISGKFHDDSWANLSEKVKSELRSLGYRIEKHKVIENTVYLIMW